MRHFSMLRPYTVLESSRLRGPLANRNCSVAITQLRKSEFQSDTVQTPTSLLIYFRYRLAESECIHARKWIAATVADRTSSVPEVSESHGPATHRPRHQRIREPRVRVWQVLHDESCSGGD